MTSLGSGHSARGASFARRTDTLQVVVGPIADQLAGEMRRSLHKPAVAAQLPADAGALLAALGGPGNVHGLEAASTPPPGHGPDDARVDEQALAQRRRADSPGPHAGQRARPRRTLPPRRNRAER